MSEKYNAEICLYEKLKRDIADKREKIESKTKEMETSKEEF